MSSICKLKNGLVTEFETLDTSLDKAKKICEIKIRMKKNNRKV